MPSIARRIALVAILLGLTAPALAQLQPHIVASGLDRPIAFVQDPTDHTVQIIPELGGHIRVLVDYVVQPNDFLDLSGNIAGQGENGLLGFAFAPDYASSGWVFVDYINASGDTVIARYTRSGDNPLQADPGSGFALVWPTGLDFIQTGLERHKGGNIIFGPDHNLYIGLGDGADSNDPDHNAQNPLLLVGKMLRINVMVSADDPEGYDIPGDNPFVGQADVYWEIWSFGWRNPWRWSFDDPDHGGTGALVIADVGQADWEEIDYEPAGAGGRNYGWRNREGAHAHLEDLPPYSEPLTDPLFEYNHDEGNCVTGGYVYRGQALGPSMVGRYFFGDFGSGRIWSLRFDVDPTTHEATATDLQEHTDAFGGPSMWVSFGTDWAGELYAVAFDGNIWRFNANPTPPEPPAVVLWSLGNVAHTWRLNGDSFLGMVGFTGPGPGWTAEGYSRNANSTYELLWTADDAAQLSFFNADDSAAGGLGFSGPGPGWNATGYFRNPNGSYELLWAADGVAQVWMINSDNTWGGGFGLGGPGAGWRATCYLRAADGSHHVVWTRNNEAQIWTITSGLAWGGMIGLGGPGLSGSAWMATGYTLNSDGTWNVVWSTLNLAQVWTMSAAGEFVSMFGMSGPAPGWTVQNYFK